MYKIIKINNHYKDFILLEASLKICLTPYYIEDNNIIVISYDESINDFIQDLNYYLEFNYEIINQKIVKKQKLYFGEIKNNNTPHTLHDVFNYFNFSIHNLRNKELKTLNGQFCLMLWLYHNFMSQNTTKYLKLFNFKLIENKTLQIEEILRYRKEQENNIKEATEEFHRYIRKTEAAEKDEEGFIINPGDDEDLLDYNKYHKSLKDLDKPYLGLSFLTITRFDRDFLKYNFIKFLKFQYRCYKHLKHLKGHKYLVGIRYVYSTFSLFDDPNLIKQNREFLDGYIS